MDEKTEIRSRKIRNIIGAVPTRLERYGITVIAIITAGLLAAASLIPYPETAECTAIAESGNTVILLIPYRHAGSVRAGMTVSIEFEGYKAETYGYVNGTVNSADRAVRTVSRANFFTANANVKSAGYTLRRGMKGSATMIVSERTVLRRILNW